MIAKPNDREGPGLLRGLLEASTTEGRMRENRTSGTVRGGLGDRRSCRERVRMTNITIEKNRNELINFCSSARIAFLASSDFVQLLI